MSKALGFSVAIFVVGLVLFFSDAGILLPGEEVTTGSSYDNLEPTSSPCIDIAGPSTIGFPFQYNNYNTCDPRFDNERPVALILDALILVGAISLPFVIRETTKKRR